MYTDICVTSCLWSQLFPSISKYLNCQRQIKFKIKMHYSFLWKMFHLRCDELQATALPVLLPLQQIPHLRVILSQTLLACPWPIFIHCAGAGVGLLTTYNEANWGSLAQWLSAEEKLQGWGVGCKREDTVRGNGSIGKKVRFIKI